MRCLDRVTLEWLFFGFGLLFVAAVVVTEFRRWWK